MPKTACRRPGWRLVAGVALSLVLGVAGTPAAWAEQGEPPPAPAAPERRRVAAPDFPPGLAWLNTDRPLTMAELKGKVVLLDFWTYACINCLHVIPELKYLEAKYADELVVIGVHSAKFDNEKLTENIRQAILRYGREDPVVNDADFLIWRRWGVRAWPTLILIDPEGYVVGGVSGEGNRELLDEVIGRLVEKHRAQGTLRPGLLKLAPERTRATATPLRFPGKVLADGAGQRLFIADTNHHRIVIADLEGKVLAVAGAGGVGVADGPFAKAIFNHPQGMALDGSVLYVADTDNHLIRKLDLAARTVSTIAGTGEQATEFNQPGKGRAVPLNSPWDLVVVGQRLYIAMAGSHQIWVMDLASGELEPFSGSGREDIADGPRLEAAMAQPSGIATDGRVLYVADSEVSGIRAVDLGPGGQVRTVVGEGLFEFGDRDGKGSAVRLQHPLGVATHDGKLYVADTYNHKIKIVSPAERTAATFLGSGKAGFQDGKGATFYEPSGLSVVGGRLYVADTNNHAIRVADLKTGEVSTLRLAGLAIPDAVLPFAGASFREAERITLAPHRLKAGSEGRLLLDLKLPAGYVLNPLAPVSYEVRTQGDALTVDPDRRRGTFAAEVKALAIPFRTGSAGKSGAAEVAVTFYFCRADKTGLCYIQSVAWHVPVEAQGTGGGDVPLPYAATIPHQ